MVALPTSRTRAGRPSPCAWPLTLPFEGSIPGDEDEAMALVVVVVLPDPTADSAPCLRDGPAPVLGKEWCWSRGTGIVMSASPSAMAIVIGNSGEFGPGVSGGAKRIANEDDDDGGGSGGSGAGDDVEIRYVNADYGIHTVPAMERIFSTNVDRRASHGWIKRSRAVPRQCWGFWLQFQIC